MIGRDLGAEAIIAQTATSCHDLCHQGVPQGGAFGAEPDQFGHVGKSGPWRDKDGHALQAVGS